MSGILPLSLPLASSISNLQEQSEALCLPSLQKAVARLASPMDNIAGYHFGWNDRHGRPTGGNGGKSVRPALALLSAQAASADPMVGVPAGVAVELVHNFSLLHDDFMDGDELRRGRPTAWTVFGSAQAILTGDALLALATDVLLSTTTPGVAPQDVARALKRLSTANCRLVDGQALDLSYEFRERITVEECLRMEGGKTGALLGCASSIGAVLAGADETTIDALDRFGRHLGLAFQAVDDLLGIWGEPASTGKPRWGDLRRRKKSLPICAALEEGGTASRQLTDILGTPNSTDQDERQLALIASLVEEAGGRVWTQDEAGRQYESALGALDEIAMPETVRDQFTSLAAFVVRRTR